MGTQQDPQPDSDMEVLSGRTDPLVMAVRQGVSIDAVVLSRAITYRERQLDLLADEVAMLQEAKARLQGDGRS